MLNLTMCLYLGSFPSVRVFYLYISMSYSRFSPFHFVSLHFLPLNNLMMMENCMEIL